MVFEARLEKTMIGLKILAFREDILMVSLGCLNYNAKIVRFTLIYHYQQEVFLSLSRD